MRQSVAIALLFGVGAGCSLIYNPSNLGQPADAKVFEDAVSIDAAIDAPPVLDADPTMLAIDDVFPKTIYAGQGSNGSFPVTLAIHGKDIVDGFMLTISGSTQVHVIGTPMHSADRNWIAAQVEIDTGSAGADTPLTISVSEPDNGSGGMSMAMSGTLMLANPPSLIGGGSGSATGTGPITVDVSTLATTTYQIIDATHLTFTDTGGTGDAIWLRSYSSVTLGAISEPGQPGTKGGAAGAAGQGGCAGGGAGAQGQCSTADGGGGGASSSTNNGGGGGGFATSGDNGVMGVSGGNAHGEAILVNLGPDTNHVQTNQSAGGGGGNLTGLNLGASAGTGGGGGGSVVIEAGGSISVTSIDVTGGVGGTGVASVADTATAGGGGGGAGGVIILRSTGSTIVSTSLDAKGGAGGTPGDGGPGGQGSVGRVRIDTSGTVPTANIPVHQGPVFAATNPTITADVSQSVSMIGQAGDMVTLRDIDGSGTVHTGEAMNVSFDETGHATIPLSLLDGYNEVCATLGDGVTGTELADSCFELVYLP